MLEKALRCKLPSRAARSYSVAGQVALSRPEYLPLPPRDRYSVISEGVSQLLDHILVTPELAVRQVRVDVLHVNADHPPADPDQTNLYHSSSHDPIAVFFDLGD